MNIQNRKAKHEYIFVETWNAGIVLVGAEIKSLRDGLANVGDAWCYLKDGEVFVKNLHISPYPNACQEIDPLRERKLLLKKREIEKISRMIETKGMSLIVTDIFVEKRAKVKIAVAKGKKDYDKRETIKERDVKRETARDLANR